MLVSEEIRKDFERKALALGFVDFRRLSNNNYIEENISKAWFMYQDLAIGNEVNNKKQLAKIKEIERDAALGKVAMKFIDRAGNINPGIDNAETICAEFYAAMIEELEKWLHLDPHTKKNKTNK